VFGIGGYQLTINELGFLNNLLGGVTATVNYGLSAITDFLLNNDLHSNDSFTTATPLPPMRWHEMARPRLHKFSARSFPRRRWVCVSRRRQASALVVSSALVRL